MWYIMKKLSLVEVIEEIEDTRRNNTVIYPLSEILEDEFVELNITEKEPCSSQFYWFGEQDSYFFRNYLYSKKNLCIRRSSVSSG